MMKRRSFSFTLLVVTAAVLSAGGGAQTTDGPDSRQSPDDCGESMRSVEHEFGVTCIPLRPTRVATNVESMVANLLLSGIQPLTGPEDQEGWNEPYAALFPPGLDIHAITDSGVTESTNLEVLLAEDPELIMTYPYSAVDFYEAFSAIAPTVVVERGENSAWRARFDREAAYLDREAEAARVVARYEEAIAALREFSNLTVAFVRRPRNGTFRLDAQGSFPGSVMDDAGLRFTTAPDGVGEFDGSTVGNINEERLDILSDADAMLVIDFSDDGDVDSVPEAFVTSPLLPSLNV